MKLPFDKFISELGKLPAEILEINYNAEHFGSWVIKVRFGGQRFQFVYDGREGLLKLEISQSKKAPDKDWVELWETKITSDWIDESLSELKTHLPFETNR